MFRLVAFLVFYCCFLCAHEVEGQRHTPVIEFHDIISDTLVLNHSKFPESYRMKMVTNHKGADFLYVFDCKKGGFEIFDLWTKTHIKTINPPVVEGLPGFKAVSFDIMSPNEIYMLSQKGNLIQLDSAGKMVEHWLVTQELDNEEYAISVSDHLNNFAVMDQKAYLPIMHAYQKNGSFTLKGKPAMIVYDLAAGEVEKEFAGYPKSTYKSNNLPSPKYEFTTLKMKDEERLVISYLKDPELKAYKFKNNKAKSSKAESPFLNDNRIRPQKDQFGNVIQYSNPNGFYHNIYYDENRQLFYRTVAHHHDNGNSLARRPFSIQVIDKNFNLLSEIKVPGSEPLDHMKLTVIKEGILLQICQQKKPEEVRFLVLDVNKSFRD
ncbi:DUF4221 family protein [Litoribacter ruber]|uniref:DUF4221 family protein n=1 Tax=Litoribacter ruber TaxID=702568 RepID=UPI001BDA4ADC|nr:DUF4221 family protein [Litoribacter ruber]MBT0810570.1 DUF4221 family protein [Litoribacter ruber]